MQRTKNRDKKKLEEYKNLIEGDEIAKNNALISFYLHINPETLSDEQWAKKVNEIHYVLKFTGVLTDKKDGEQFKLYTQFKRLILKRNE